jgi:putative ABC transport system permease protein
MLKNHFTIALRKLVRDKAYTLINVAGLAIGLTSFLMITLFIRDELSYDKFHSKSDRIYRIYAKGFVGNTPINQTYTCAPLPQTMIADFPEVVQATRIAGKWSIVVKFQDKAFYEDNILVVDSTFFDVFDFKLVRGDPETVLVKPNSVVITESTARRYFGDDDPIGKYLTVEEGEEVIQNLVTGITEDPPSNSHFHFDILAALSSFDFSRSTQWMNNNFKTYLVLKEGTDYKALESKFPAFIKKYIGGDAPEWDQWIAAGNSWEYFLQPLKDIHLGSDLNGEIEPNGNKMYIYIFSIVAIFTLLIACINFMNLSTARSAGRSKEVGIRKVAGAGRHLLIRQFLLESVTFSILATILSAAIVIITLPLFNNLTGKQFEYHDLFTAINIGIVIFLALIVGIISGTYPAFYLSSFQPSVIIKDVFRSGSSKSVLRTILMVFQFVISIALITGTIIVYRQLNYFQNKDLGFNKDNILIIKRPQGLRNNVDVFKENLLKYPSIKNVSASSAIMGMEFNNWGCSFEGSDENQWTTLNMFITDHDFLETYSMKMDSGRFFSREFPTDSDGIVVNNPAAKLFETPGVLGKKITYGGDDNFHVIGIIRDFHYESFHQVIRPAAIMLLPGIWGAEMNYLSIKMTGEDPAGSIKYIKDKWDEFSSGMPIEYTFFNEEYNRQYQNEIRTGKVLAVFSILAILIACLGLLGLSSFITEQRTKEIGIRKIQGASTGKILTLLFREFVKWILLATIIAWPIAYFLMKDWLENFSFRINFPWFSMILSALLTLVIAIITVSFQTIRASRANPADSLRYE